MIENPITNFLSANPISMNMLQYNKLFQEYLDYILYSKEYKVFSGIPRDYSNRYIREFHEMLKLNEFNMGELGSPIYMGDYTMFVCYFVLQDGTGHAFGSFSKAYMFGAKQYLDSIIISENDIIKEISENVDVLFGRISIQDFQIASKDVISVVNKKYYKNIYNKLIIPFD